MHRFKNIYLLLFVLSACTNPKSQDKSDPVKQPIQDVSKLNVSDPIYDSLKVLFSRADTILLIGNKVSDPFETPKPIIIKGKFVDSVVMKKVLIKGSEVDSLLNILKGKVEDMTNSQKCGSVLDHAIVLLKKNQVSFIRLSFSCWNLKATADLKPFLYLDDKKLAYLENFFRKKNALYYRNSEVK